MQNFVVAVTSGTDYYYYYYYCYYCCFCACWRCCDCCFCLKPANSGVIVSDAGKSLGFHSHSSMQFAVDYVSVLLFVAAFVVAVVVVVIVVVAAGTGEAPLASIVCIPQSTQRHTHTRARI